MNQPQERPASDSSSKLEEAASHSASSRFWIASAILALCFGWPLLQLANFALKRDLYSHILLIPFISGYLVWERRRELPGRSAPDKASASLFAVFGALCLAGFAIMRMTGSSDAPEDSLALEIPAFLFFFIAVCLVFLGRPVVRMIAFPLAFLFFMVPFPAFVMDWIVSGLQVGSAKTADVMFELSGTPVVFQGLVFRLPDITLEVAPECSGIHSTLALLVTSVVAAFLFLRSPWKRTVLILAVIPLALIRNGFRIFVIGELCVHFGPQMINSYIHRHGGPIFFVLSLVPFFALLYFFSKGDRRRYGLAGSHSPFPKK